MRNRVGRLARAWGDPAPVADEQLVAAYLADPGGPAFADLVARHGPMVLGVCRRVLRHAQDAEDAFQATFVVLARRAGDIWPRAAVGAWLYGVAYRVAQKSRAGRTRRLERERPLDAEPAAVGPEMPDDSAQLLAGVIGHLPAIYRAAVVACDLDGLSRKAAAARLGWSEGTLSGRLARARKLLAARARRAGLTLPAGGLVAAFGPAAGVEARLVAATVALARVPADGVPGSVGVLTEGVVTAMVTTKAKLVAAVMVAGAIGFGMWASAGVGDRPGAGPGGAKAGGAATEAPGAEPPPAVTAAPGPRLELTLQELDVLTRDIDAVAAKKNATPADFERLNARVAAARELLAPGKELFRTPPDVPGMAAELKKLQGKWRTVSVRTHAGARKPYSEDPRDLIVEFRGNKFRVPFVGDAGAIQYVESTIWRLDPSKSPKQIDLISPEQLVERGIYDIRTEGGQTTLVWSFGRGFRPAALGNPPDEVWETTFRRVADEPPGRPSGKPLTEAELTPAGAADARLKAAEQRAAAAQVGLHMRQIDLEKTKVAVQQAAEEWEREKAALDEARKAVEAQKPAAGAKKPADPGITVYVRPLDAPEKAIPLPLTGNDTVIDAVKAAGDAVPLARGPDRLSVWVARGKTILPVDLDGITRHGLTQTNYQLFAGDKLFVQVKP